MADLRVRNNSGVDCLVLCFADNSVWIRQTPYGT